ncbi:MAG: biotin--[acetyl-CoA-carboxylase] ligase, partial [Ruminococcaceae bacterium]|nr:biotin--[acetyl-CoA-carboxylase] ligase [Oscillospiraceae bacterium]
AVAVCKAIEKISGVSCGIKWVNDIYLGDGKLAGILVESINNYEKMISEYLIIGVGVNIDHSPEIVDAPYNAASLADLGIKLSPSALCGEIVSNLLEIRENEFDFSKYIDEYRSHSIVFDREISFTSDGKTKNGVAVDINDRGALIVKTDNKEITLDSGEISIRFRP